MRTSVKGSVRPARPQTRAARLRYSLLVLVVIEGIELIGKAVVEIVGDLMVVSNAG